MTQPTGPKPLNLTGLYGIADPFASESDDDRVDSKPDSPDVHAAAAAPVSPASYVQKLLADNELFRGLSAKESEALTEQLKKFSTCYPDSPFGKLLANKLKGTAAALAGSLSDQPFNSPAFHREAYPTLANGGWGMTIARHLRATMCAYPVAGQHLPYMVNLAHVVEGEATKGGKPVGFHFCPPGNPLRKELANVVVNPATRVFAGRFRLTPNGPPKFSTFFPDFIRTEEELLDVIQGAHIVARNGNYVLSEVTFGHRRFYMESITHERGELVVSAYPLFYVGDYEQGSVHQLTDTLLIPSDEILKAIMYSKDPKTLVRDLFKYQIRDEDDDLVLLDVAPLFEKQTGIGQGICISFPAELVYRLMHPEKPEEKKDMLPVPTDDD